jgi:hypothetical protein
MRVFLIILCVTIVFSSCKKEENLAVEVIQPRKEDIATIRNILDGAVSRQQSTPSGQSRGRAHEEALAIFQDFWNPKMIKRYGRHEWDTELYADAKYVIVQRSLVVATKKTEEWPIDELKYMYRPSRQKEEDWLVETIDDFCPSVSIPDTIVVSLTKDLADELKSFLGGNFSEAATSEIMSPAQSVDESRIKHAAADTMVRIYSKHWGDGWHLISHPEVEQILFDSDYQHALVAFRIVYQGGYALYEKTSEGWKLDKTIIEWTE